jgi:subtilisin family serine protease
MPTMTSSGYDRDLSGGTFPNGDETGPADGWLVASGSSAATPMVAGAAAVLLSARPSLTPTELRHALCSTCRDVTQGVSASGEAAGIGPDAATGAGLLDVTAALDSVATVGAVFASDKPLRA